MTLLFGSTFIFYCQLCEERGAYHNDTDVQVNRVTRVLVFDYSLLVKKGCSRFQRCISLGTGHPCSLLCHNRAKTSAGLRSQSMSTTDVTGQGTESNRGPDVKTGTLPLLVSSRKEHLGTPGAPCIVIEARLSTLQEDFVTNH